MGDTTIMSERSTIADTTYIDDVKDTTMVADRYTVTDMMLTNLQSNQSFVDTTYIGDVTDTTMMAERSTGLIFITVLVSCCALTSLIVLLVIMWIMRKKRSYDVMAKHCCTVTYKDDKRPIGAAGENMARRSVAYDECDLVPIDELATRCFTVEGEWIHETGERDSSDTNPGVTNWTSHNQNYLP